MESSDQSYDFETVYNKAIQEIAFIAAASEAIKKNDPAVFKSVFEVALKDAKNGGVSVPTPTFEDTLVAIALRAVAYKRKKEES